MNLTDLSQELRSYLDARVTVQLISAPGLGKSDTIRDTVHSYSQRDGFEWGLATILAAAYTPPDVMGYLVPREVMMAQLDGTQAMTPTSEFTMPPWMMSDDGKPMNSYKRGVVFFDEWDKIEPDTKRTLANVILNGVAGRWMVHDGIGFVTAANRAEDRSGSTKEYDFIINRRAEVHIRPDVDAWEVWATRRGIPALFIAFAKRHPDVVFAGKVPDKQGPYCTPRSYVMGANLLQHSGVIDQHGVLHGVGNERTETRLSEKLSGLWGVPATNQFLVWSKMQTEAPTFEDIIMDPRGTFVPKKADAKLLVCYDLAHRINVKNSDAAMAYALRLPKEMQIVFGCAAIRRDPSLLGTNAFQEKFIPENQEIIALVAQG